MKIQVTKIEAGQTIKVAKMYKMEMTINAALYGLEKWGEENEYYQNKLRKAKRNLSNNIIGTFDTEGKHTLEFKVLEVKKYAQYTGVNLGNRTFGSNETLLVTDKGSYLIPNRNKVTLVD